jgi:DNA mismatch repair protein MutS
LSPKNAPTVPRRLNDGYIPSLGLHAAFMPDGAPTSPMLEQYEAVKSQYPGHLVLFRVGDFYETFGDDARLLSHELDVVLTARAPDNRGDRTPMAGVPYHAVETYLGRLVRKGHKVVICDQVEDSRFSKGLVRREVTRVVTPGTVVEERILDGPAHNFLAIAVLGPDGSGTFCAVDVSTGEWFRGRGDGPGPEGLTSALAVFAPREILWAAPEGLAPSLSAALRREFADARLERAPAPVSPAEVPTGLREPDSSAGAIPEADLRLIAFLRVTSPRLLPHLDLREQAVGGRRLMLDAKTLRHLEILRPMNPDDPKGPTLLDAWDETTTAVGRRTLAFWLSRPLADRTAISSRQDAVESLLRRGSGIEELRTELRGVADLARIASRVVSRRARPAEIGTLRASLKSIQALRRRLEDRPLAGRVAELAAELDGLGTLLEQLESALPETVPVGDDGAILFREGHDAEVDRWREAERTALRELGELERVEQNSTGIRTLRVGYNQVFGYYFEVTRPHLARVPPHFRRRQTVAQAERFTSDRLEELERRILEARESAREAAATRWESLLGEVERATPGLRRVARAVGELDTLLAFAVLAQTRGYVRPTVDDASAIVIRAGRHPVLERALDEEFVPNDTDLDVAGSRLLVLTGPNMAGKSTYMRQVGLIVILAQAGSYVPARFARIGVVDRLFTRMGFTDEIGRGKSSFMVEMSEVAEILRGADERSLVLLDEVGRGTSTFDGLAIAWATLKHLHDRTRARCILATHFHQLTDLVDGLSGARNAHLAVADRPEGVVFLHRVVPGATDRSYGVHVARLAGLPDDVLDEAERLLRRLESDAPPIRSKGSPRATRYTQAVLLAAEGRDGNLRDELEQIDVERLSPEEVRAKLRELQRRLGPPPQPEPGR